ncbi:hypothetical protein Ae201684P_010997 [Aphanomyces euteiches]|nr:hypothetical protein Ae201684P_010997 [Aphanomyces euteiches]
MTSRTAMLPLKAVSRLVRKRTTSNCTTLDQQTTPGSYGSAILATCGLVSVVVSSEKEHSRNDAMVSSTPNLHRYFDEDYDLVNARTLGQGAFGMVMQCVHKEHKTVSAVKVVADGYNEAEREKNALSCVEHAGGHPNIHTIRLCRAAQATQPRGTILMSIASALEFMHAHGMVHCDLKPDNVMIADDMKVKIIDFGSATIPNPTVSGLPLKRALTLSTAPLSGTKTYWSPEMLAGKSPIQVGPSMDMWSLGCLLYIMLSGRHPFDARGNLSEEMILHNIVHAPVVFSGPVWASVSPEMKALVQQMLEKDPEARLTAAQLVAKLNSLM